jgi:hypothetical protein
MGSFNRTSLIAPCGMNCGYCMAYLRERNKCPGCRLFNKDNPVSIAKCKIKNCATFKRGKAKFCFVCKGFPCDRLKDLDKRYRTKYNMSMIENLMNIQKSGVRRFVKNEKERWTCGFCRGKICIHKGYCVDCGKKMKP